MPGNTRFYIVLAKPTSRSGVGAVTNGAVQAVNPVGTASDSSRRLSQQQKTQIGQAAPAPGLLWLLAAVIPDADRSRWCPRRRPVERVLHRQEAWSPAGDHLALPATCESR